LQKQFYSQLEGLRGFAILLVFASHFIIAPYVARLHFLKLGFLGVNIFFVLSGFLITEILLREIYAGSNAKTILKNFYTRRALRIFPIYYLAVFIIYIFHTENSREALPYTLTYTYNIAYVWFNAESEAVNHFWSLCVEEQFYLFWPLLLVGVNKKFHLHLIISVIVLALLSRIVYCGFRFENYQKFLWATPATLDCLGLGALLAYFKQNCRQLLAYILKYYAVPLMAVLVFWAGVKFTMQDPETISMFYLISGGFIAGIAGFYMVGSGVLEFPGMLKKLLNAKLLRFFGKISYGLYVYHWILFFFLHKKVLEWVDSILKGQDWVTWKLKNNSYIISFVFFTAASVIVALVSYYMIEKRFLKIKESFS
jgi:peptidoglycan/LPS O-acetylase OafA/YrhL